MISNHVTDCILDRASCRIFEDAPLTKEEEDTILTAAMRAPTAANLQLYSIIVIRDPETKKKLAKTCNNQPWLEKVPYMLVFCADYQRIYDFYDSSNVGKKCKELKIPYIRPGEQFLFLAQEDAILAAQNAVLAGESIGISSCYVGHIMDYWETHAELFDLPRYVFPVVLLAMGRPARTAKKIKTERFKKEYIVFEEKYRKLTKEELNDCYSRFPSAIEGNRYGAENKGQYHYLSRYTNSPCYWEGIRSLRAALKNWDYDIDKDE